MITHAFAIQDIKIGVFHAPFFFMHEALALRAFGDMAKDANTSIGRHPADFVLYRIGTFDDQVGALSPLPSFHSYGSALSLITSMERQAEMRV